MRWSTPVGAYARVGPARVGPARVATHGEAVWHPASGTYSYGQFELRSRAYNVQP